MLIEADLYNKLETEEKMGFITTEYSKSYDNGDIQINHHWEFAEVNMENLKNIILVDGVDEKERTEKIKNKNIYIRDKNKENELLSKINKQIEIKLNEMCEHRIDNENKCKRSTNAGCN